MVLLPVVIEPLSLAGQIRCFAARRNGWPFVSIPLAAFIAMREGPEYQPYRTDCRLPGNHETSWSILNYRHLAHDISAVAGFGSVKSRGLA